MKKLYFKKWVEKTLIFVNCFIFCFIACIDDFKSIEAYLLIVLIGGAIFYINFKLIAKYGRLYKEIEED